MISTEGIDTRAIQMKLYEKLKLSGWGNTLKSFILSSDFTMIIDQLFQYTQLDKRFTPPIKNIFNAFQECKYEDLKVVLVAPSPYKVLGVDSGSAFDCRNTGKEEFYLENIFNAIEKTVYPGQKYERDVNLQRWAKQGVLLLNMGLTTQLRELGKHTALWRPFMTFLFDTLNTLNPGLIFVFLGSESNGYAAMINSTRHYKYSLSHPGTLITGTRDWDCENIFVEINRVLKKDINIQITW